MLQRILLLLLAAIYPTFWIIFKFTRIPIPIDDPKQRIIVVILCLIVYRLYESDNPKIRNRRNLITSATFYIITLHSLYLSYLNHFSVEFQVQSFILITFISLGFIRKYELFYYLFFTFVCFIPITVSGFQKLDIYYILCTLLLVGAGSFVIQMFHIYFLKQLLVNDKSLLNSVDKIKDGIIITDTTSHVLYVNEVAQKLLNFNSEFLIGSKVNLPIPPEDRLTGNVSVIHTVEDQIVEIRMVKVESYGMPAFFIIIKDITRQTREKLETERKRLLQESILVSVKEVLVGLDKEGRITYTNPYIFEVTGYREEDILDKPFHEVFQHSWIDGSPHEEENSPIRDTLTDGITNRINNDIFWRKGDEFFYVEYTSSPIKKDDIVNGAVVLFKDISVKKKQEEIDKRYNEELLFLSESATRFLESTSKTEIYDYIVSSIFEFAKPRAVIVNSYDEEKSEFKVESIRGFKQFIGPIVKLINSELIGARFRVDTSRFPQFTANQNKLVFLSDGLYNINFGNLNRKECMMIESMLNTYRVYTFTFSESARILGSVIILYPDEKFSFETMLEIFLHQATVALNKNFP